MMWWLCEYVSCVQGCQLNKWFRMSVTQYENVTDVMWGIDDLAKLMDFFNSSLQWGYSKRSNNIIVQAVQSKIYILKPPFNLDILKYTYVK